MVDFNKDNVAEAKDGIPSQFVGAKAEAVVDVVCPVHFKLLLYPQVMPICQDKSVRYIRTYFGWCFECNRGFAVIQFRRGKRWIIHKYRSYSLDKFSEKVTGDMDWVTLNELPAIKAKASNDELMVEVLAETLKSLQCCVSSISLILNDIAKKIGQSIDD